MSKQVDAYSLYEAGARELLNRIGEDHPLYPNALGYQHRLRENLEQCQPHGETDTLRVERNRIINELNKLAVSVLGISFRELCEQVGCIQEQEPSECLLHIDDPLSLVELGPAGPVRLFLENAEESRSYSDCEQALQLCSDAVEWASKHGNQAQLALAYLYQADAHARNNRLQAGVKLAERARRILRIWGDRHNTMVAQLLIARLQVSRNSNDARRKYLEALDLCRKLKSGKRETARDEEALLYEQIIEGIQQALNGVSKVVKEPYEHRCSLNSIPILRLSDGPDAIVGRSGVIDHVANGEFRIGGRTYFLHPLNETAGHTLELRDSAVHFVLPVPEDGWLDPASKEGDYALARWDPQVTQEGPGVMWTENEWVAGRFERDTEGDFRFCPQPPRMIGSQKIELCKVVALLRRTTRRSLGGSGV